MFRSIGKVLFWTYERGSWQYDVMCGVILLFIFLTPVTVFDGSFFTELKSQETSLEEVQARQEQRLSEDRSIEASEAEPNATASR